MITWAIIIGLAVYRVWRIAALDTITEPFHGRLAMTESRVGQWLYSLVSCAWCLPFWLALAATVSLAVFYGWDVPTMIFTWLASCTITGMVHELLEARDG